jgi:hypothetical protein
MKQSDIGYDHHLQFHATVFVQWLQLDLAKTGDLSDFDTSYTLLDNTII